MSWICFKVTQSSFPLWFTAHLGKHHSGLAQMPNSWLSIGLGASSPLSWVQAISVTLVTFPTSALEYEKPYQIVLAKDTGMGTERCWVRKHVLSSWQKANAVSLCYNGTKHIKSPSQMLCLHNQCLFGGNSGISVQQNDYLLSFVLFLYMFFQDLLRVGLSIQKRQDCFHISLGIQLRHDTSRMVLSDGLALTFSVL